MTDVSMRCTKAFSTLLVASAIAVLLMPGAVAAETRTLERIVAVVNDRLILESDLEEQMALLRQQFQQEGQQPPPEETMREHVLDELITESLQLQRARQFGITVSDDMVNRALQEIANRNNTDLTGLRDMFAAQGVEFATVRDDIRTHLIIQQLQQRAVASRVNVSEQDVDDFVTRLDEVEDEDVEYRVQHILLSAPRDGSDEAIEEARQQALRLAAELREGGDFEAMAAEVSDGPRALEGGDLGWRAPDQLPALFLEALDGLRPGDVAEPVQSANGFHILRLTDRRGGVDQAITETRARHILIREGEDSEIGEDEARERIARLRQRLEAGASFADLAQGHSEDPGSARDGGSLGWFGPGDMVPAFHDVVDDLEIGELSEPFRTEFGWHIVEVQERRQVEDAERHQRAQARQALFRERVQEETRRWLRELRDEAFVDKRLDGIQSGS